MKKTKMNARRVAPVLMAGIMFVSGAALADRDFIKSDVRHAEHDSFEYAKVIQVTPVYREIKTTVPVKECWQEPVRREQVVRHGSHSAGGTLAGGLIGGIIGHQFGKGSGQKLATAVGTIVGAQIGHDALIAGTACGKISNSQIRLRNFAACARSGKRGAENPRPLRRRRHRAAGHERIRHSGRRATRRSIHDRSRAHQRLPGKNHVIRQHARWIEDRLGKLRRLVGNAMG